MARKEIGDLVARPIRDAVARMAVKKQDAVKFVQSANDIAANDHLAVEITTQQQVDSPPRIWWWRYKNLFEEIQFNTFGVEEKYGLRTTKFEMAEILFGPFPIDVQMNILKRLAVGNPGGLPQPLEAELLALAEWQLGNLVDVHTGNPPNILTLTGEQVALLVKFCCILGMAIATGVGIIVTVDTADGQRSGAVMGISCENGRCVFVVRLVPADQPGQDFIDYAMDLVVCESLCPAGGRVHGKMRPYRGGEAQPVSVTGGVMEW